MDGIMLMCGSFTSTGLSQTIAIPSNVDYMWVKNYTQLTANRANLPLDFYWQYGMAYNDGIVTLKNAAATATTMSTLVTQGINGFVLIDQGAGYPLVGPAVAFTAISNAVQPVVSTANTAGLSVGSVVRLSQSAALPPDDPSLLGIDWQVSAVNAGVSFTLQGPLPQAPGNAGTAGFYRIVNVSSIFYPQTRYIINITAQAVTGYAVVTTSVNHGYVPGQIVRFNLYSSLNGMRQINTQSATIISVTASTFVANINITGFDAFVFPTNAQWVPYTPANTDLPMQDTAFSLANNLNTLSDAEYNTSIVGMQLNGGNAAANGIAGPAGAVGDVMFWVAGKCYNGH
jgi:hypothetical protein